MLALARRNTVATDLNQPRVSMEPEAQDHPGEHLQAMLDSLRKDDWQSQQAAHVSEAQSLERLLEPVVSR